jgi:putative ATP-dependent endonuclease of OLD family
VQAFISHPTLEPSITKGNEKLVAAAISATGLAAPDEITPESVHEFFRSAREENHDAEGHEGGAGREARGRART